MIHYIYGISLVYFRVSIVSGQTEAHALFFIFLL
jgi:hypothetical protein